VLGSCALSASGGGGLFQARERVDERCGPGPRFLWMEFPAPAGEREASGDV